MATRKPKPRGSSGSVTRKPAKAAKPAKVAASSARGRGIAAKPALASKAVTTPKKKATIKRGSAVIAYLTVKDVVASLAFYEQAFGFKRGETLLLPDGSLIQVVMHFSGGVAVKFSPEGIWSGSMQAPATSGAENPIVLYVPCRKVDDLTARARGAGATIASEPADMFWGERIARIVDPDGYVWCFAAKVGKFDPTKIPQVAEAIQPPQTESQQEPAAESQAQESHLDFEL